jgi:hypothetical protein
MPGVEALRALRSEKFEPNGKINLRNFTWVCKTARRCSARLLRSISDLVGITEGGFAQARTAKANLQYISGQRWISFCRYLAITIAAYEYPEGDSRNGLRNSHLTQRPLARPE